MRLLEVFHQGNGVLAAVFVLLVLMSVASWSLIIVSGQRLWRTRRRSLRLNQMFWDAQDMEAAIQAVRAEDHPLARIATEAQAALQHFDAQAARKLAGRCSLDEFLVRAIRNRLSKEITGHERGLTFLASVGSTAPFIGLFGTVWGIYHALLGLSARGQATIDAVAAPLGEALIMTALGLAVAIPAVLGYNALVRGNRVLTAELDAFAHDLHALLLTGARPGAQPAREAA